MALKTSSSEGATGRLSGVKHVIAVGSGKGASGNRRLQSILLLR